MLTLPYLLLTPPFTDCVQQALGTVGYAVLRAQDVCAAASVSLTELEALTPSWDQLPPDAHLRDGGRYRKRRHGNYLSNNGQLQYVPHRAHWQPVEYNALHGGIERWFEPIEAHVQQAAAFKALLIWLAQQASLLRGTQPWFIEAHQFRIDTADGIGRPTPEGAHRDGVDLVAVFLVNRHQIRGGETRVFAIDGPQGLRFTLDEPWSVLLLDDQRVIHESTPIQPVADYGWRDTLVVTLRAQSFQGPTT